MHHESTSIPSAALARLADADPLDDAFQELDDWARPRLRRYFQAGGFAFSDADDLVQNTLLRALRGLPRLRDPQKLVPWLFAIARRVRAGAWAHARAQRARTGGALDAEEMQVPPHDHAEARHSAQRRLHRLERAISALPGQQRQCLLLRVRDELPYGEIAATLRLSLHTVRNHLAQARKTLRRALGFRARRDGHATGSGRLVMRLTHHTLAPGTRHPRSALPWRGPAEMGPKEER